jgi:ribosomal protein S6
MLDKKYYELTLLIRPDAVSEDVKKFYETQKELFESHKMKFIHAEYWGLRHLEYQIKKNSSAHFYHLHFFSDNALNAILKEKLAISDLVIRYLLLSANKDTIGITSPNAKDTRNDNEEVVVCDDKYKSLLSVLF